jgi:23S rRNA (uracil1939-C5)-methyltransferase
MELTVGAMVAGGAPLAHAPDGRVAFVEGALPGERVVATVTESRHDHLRARIVDVLDPSPDRVAPPCPQVAAGCGGCTWQHIAPGAQLALKRAIVTDALRRIARLAEPPPIETVALPATGYRTTVRALVHDARAALRARRSHDPVRADPCLVAHPLVAEVLHAGRFPGAREVTIRAGARTGERLVLTDPRRARVSVPEGVTHGPRASIHEVVLGRRLRISARSFFQARPDGADALVRVVRDAVGPDRAVADLYAGVGLFAALIDTPRALIVVEGARSAVADARANLAGLPARVHHADVTRFRLPPVDVVVADPSRAGLRAPGVAAIVVAEPERVVLVSCDAAAGARDVALLGSEGYRPTSCTVVDLFPHSHHVEIVTVLDRAPAI